MLNLNQTLSELFSVIEGAVIAVYVTVRVLTYTGDFTRMVNSLKAIQVRQPVSP